MEDAGRSKERSAHGSWAGAASVCEPGDAVYRSEPVRVDRWHGRLAQVVQAEIIPRLMLAHRSANLRRAGGRKPTPEEIEAFCAALLMPDPEAVEARLAELIQGGLGLDGLLLDLLAPTARYLGGLWEEDLCDFTELTVAMGRLQRIMHDLTLRCGGEPARASSVRSILLAPCPGETHVFGLSILDRFFRDAGWEVTGTQLDPSPDLSALVARSWFDVVGLSLGSEVLLPVLAETVRALREESCNPRLNILVGGAIFVDNPGYATLVGADATAADARRAVFRAESLLDLQARAC
ncbi:cobalamin B12-binding domain-containing protein [Methylobacterium sp. A54F]